MTPVLLVVYLSGIASGALLIDVMTQWRRK